MGAEEAVPEGEVLAVVAREVEVVVGVVGRAVDKALEGEEEAVVDADGPHVDQHEHSHVHDLVHGEDEDKNMVWYTLQESIDGMEGMARPGCTYLPQVMSLVKCGIDPWMMKPTMNPIDTKVSKDEEL